MKMKNILLITGTILIMLNLNCAESEPEGSPIFNNVIQMRAIRSVTTITFQNVPDEAVTLVVAFFDASPISVNSNNIITNTNWTCGNRTGLPSGIGRSGSTTYYAYDQTKKDFNISSSIVPAGGVWAVWGYNSSHIIICATQEYPW